MSEHQQDCRWQRTTDAECEYRSTHHYCPHAEHACDCPPEPRATLRDEDDFTSYYTATARLSQENAQLRERIRELEGLSLNHDERIIINFHRAAHGAPPLPGSQPNEMPLPRPDHEGP